MNSQGTFAVQHVDIGGEYDGGFADLKCIHFTTNRGDI